MLIKDTFVKWKLRLNHNIRCIEIGFGYIFIFRNQMLNHNIRCIEICMFGFALIHILGVEPQHKMYWNLETVLETDGEILLNHNIRCIEIPFHVRVCVRGMPLNHNIRCIEI